jgi:hypothetical protein
MANSENTIIGNSLLESLCNNVPIDAESALVADTGVCDATV